MKINHFILNPVQNERLTEILQAVKGHILDRINTLYQFIKSFLDKNVYFEEYGAFNTLCDAMQTIHRYI